MSQVIFVLGDDISTDHIYPGRYMATVLPAETPEYCFADMKELNADLRAKKYPPGSIIVGGKNFGCGSSREQAVSTLKGHELVVIAKHFARIFQQNAVNLGFRFVICPAIEASVGDEISMDEEYVYNKTTGKSFARLPLPPARQAIVDAGGLIAYTRTRLRGMSA